MSTCGHKCTHTWTWVHGYPNICVAKGRKGPGREHGGLGRRDQVATLLVSPVMLILADHLDVPSSTLCLTAFICCVCAALVTAKISWMSSKISGLLRSRIFMRSLSTMMMFCVRSSAPCLELFSAAPAEADSKHCPGSTTHRSQHPNFRAPLAALMGTIGRGSFI